MRSPSWKGGVVQNLVRGWHDTVILLVSTGEEGVAGLVGFFFNFLGVWMEVVNIGMVSEAIATCFPATLTSYARE